MLLYLDFILSSLLSACFQVARQVSRKFRSIPSYFAFSLATVLSLPSIVTLLIDKLLDALQKRLRQYPPFLLLLSHACLPAFERQRFRLRLRFGLQRMLR